MKNTMHKLTVAALSLLILAGCENIGHITPANTEAEKTGGEIVAHFTSMGTATGTIDAIGPGGEVLNGSYGRLPADYNFGKIFNAVYGDYSTMPTAADKGTPSVTTLTGNKGTTLQCEFYNDDYTGNGFGACRAVTGALYKLQY